MKKSISNDADVEAEAIDPIQELDAMKAVSEALEGLSTAQVRRVLQWAASVHQVTAVPSTPPSHNTAASATGGAGKPSEEMIYTSFDELVEAAAPGAGPDRALVAGYWLQVVDGQENFDGFSINNMLKDLGYALANVTTTFSGLMAKKPSLAMQVGKSGKSAQSKKRYKITKEGIKAVQKMIKARADAEEA